MRIAPIAVLAVTLAVAACSPAPVKSLVGCFAAAPEGDPMLRITETGDDAWSAELADQGQWMPAAPLRMAGKDELARMFEGDADKIQAGLVADAIGVAVFRVKAGESLGDQTVDSGFVGNFFFGAGQVYKKACPQD